MWFYSLEDDFRFVFTERNQTIVFLISVHPVTPKAIDGVRYCRLLIDVFCGTRVYTCVQVQFVVQGIVSQPTW